MSVGEIVLNIRSIGGDVGEIGVFVSEMFSLLFFHFYPTFPGTLFLVDPEKNQYKSLKEKVCKMVFLNHMGMSILCRNFLRLTPP
mgnify:CR=1 FL=1